MSEFRSIFNAEMDAHIAIRTAVYRATTIVFTVSVLKEFDDYLYHVDLRKKELSEQTING